MPILTPGAFPTTAFPDRVWIDDVWPEYGTAVAFYPFIKGDMSFSDPVASDISYK